MRAKITTSVSFNIMHLFIYNTLNYYHMKFFLQITLMCLLCMQNVKTKLQISVDFIGFCIWFIWPFLIIL